jgi:hypothetical protein
VPPPGLVAGIEAKAIFPHFSRDRHHELHHPPVDRAARVPHALPDDHRVDLGHILLCALQPGAELRVLLEFDNVFPADVLRCRTATSTAPTINLATTTITTATPATAAKAAEVGEKCALLLVGPQEH